VALRMEVRKTDVVFSPGMLVINGTAQGPIFALESTSFSGVLEELTARTSGMMPSSVIFHLYEVIDDRLPLTDPRHPFSGRIVAIPVDDEPL
jgi:hypothetical protein